MASDVMTLFNMPSSQDIGQAYLNSQMVSPAQMGQQGLLQQGISMAGNQGAMMGYGAGRLLGGMAPQEARARGIEEAMAKVQSMGLTSDAEMYSALSRELAARGLTQDAFAANKEARTAMRDEQLIKKGGIDIDKAAFDLANAKEEAKFLEQRIAESEATKGVDNPEAQGLKRQLEARNQATELLKAQAYHQKKSADAQATNAAANAERAKAAANAESYTKAETEQDMMGNRRVIGKYSAKLNQFMANDGSTFKTRNELLAYDNTLRAQQQGTTKPEDNKPQQPKVPIGERIGQLQGGGTVTPTASSSSSLLSSLNRQEYAKAQKAYEQGFEVVGRGNSAFGSGDLLFENKQTGERRWGSQL